MDDDDQDPQAEPTEDLSFMMPVVSEGLEVDPLLVALLHCAAFLDFADEELVDPDLATEILDHVALYVRRLSPERLEEIQAQLERLEEHASRAGWPEEMVEFVGDFLENCSSEEGDED